MSETITRRKPLTSVAGGRISPREVLEAYRKTGYTPSGNLFVDENRACPLGAMAVIESPHVRDMWGNAGIVAHCLLAQRLSTGFSAYMTGFTCGFDGAAGAGVYGDVERVRRYRQGFRDGERARLFVFAVYGVTAYGPGEAR